MFAKGVNSKLLRRWYQLPAKELIRDKFEFETSNLRVRELVTGADIVINGWIDSKPKRISKSLIFGQLRDSNGDRVQLVDTNSLLRKCRVEDVVQVRGKVQLKRENGSSNLDNKKFEVVVDHVKTLNAANKKPSELKELRDTSPELVPPEFRYIQLRTARYQNYLRTRYEVSKTLRQILDQDGFTEIETPTLFKATPEGAREFMVPTRVSAKIKQVDKIVPMFYALTQSPQQYKQLLMASGVPKYFQFARCYRDEDLRADRQPEFTQLDMEMSFASQKDVMSVIEKCITSVWKKFRTKESTGLLTLDKNHSLTPTDASNLYRMTYKEAMTNYGIDKPDLRAPSLRILNMKELGAYSNINPAFPIFEIMIIKKAFTDKNDFKKKWSFLSNDDNYNYRKPIVVPISTDLETKNWYEKFMRIASFENTHMLNKAIRLEVGDIVVGSNREIDTRIFENPTPLGRARQLILQNNETKDIVRETNKDVAVWVVDFPLLSPKETEIKNTKHKEMYPIYEDRTVISTHHPFTMVQLQDYDKLTTNPIDCLGQHYDLVMNGIELGGGSTRIHDPELQKFMFENVLKISNYQILFGHLLSAFETGTPPHAGFAIGYDRMCAMLCGTDSIRDVIPFPKSITGSDLVVQSPSTIAEDILRDYKIEYLSRNSE
ncbi:Aminoacyl-transfer RNA synthetases class-II family profile [Nakaseomyces glabratus]|nr:Aminoacyl-transfer RNA synthetases class-II family profile [Nakaseomyces glabratus]KAH7592216.1 Aminoacyl-transfer RNA synthetases class-II family profile [Nakaseomyces glabratus]KAI8396883.1 Aminoacyl-transfer RNA synthetases class-II family profile [Nakaseomyces glabratus]